MDIGTPNVIYIIRLPVIRVWNFLPHWHMKDSRDIFTRLSLLSARIPPHPESALHLRFAEDGPLILSPLPTSTQPVI